MSTEPSIFTRIINREIPAHIIYEDEYTIVLPDKSPSMKGQLVVISKHQVEYITELTIPEYNALMDTVRRSMSALDTALHTLRTCVIIEGFETPHVHVRLYPCFEEAINLENRQEASDDELQHLATIVKQAFKA